MFTRRDQSSGDFHGDSASLRLFSCREIDFEGMPCDPWGKKGRKTGVPRESEKSDRQGSACFAESGSSELTRADKSNERGESRLSDARFPSTVYFRDVSSLPSPSFRRIIRPERVSTNLIARHQLLRRQTRKGFGRKSTGPPLVTNGSRGAAP